MGIYAIPHIDSSFSRLKVWTLTAIDSPYISVVNPCFKNGARKIRVLLKVLIVNHVFSGVVKLPRVKQTKLMNEWRSPLFNFSISSSVTHPAAFREEEMSCNELTQSLTSAGVSKSNEVLVIELHDWIRDHPERRYMHSNKSQGNMVREREMAARSLSPRWPQLTHCYISKKCRTGCVL